MIAELMTMKTVLPVVVRGLVPQRVRVVTAPHDPSEAGDAARDQRLRLAV